MQIKSPLQNEAGFCFVPSEVEKSNFYRDLEGVMGYPIKRVEKQN
jgi:hypothetical protein